MSNFVFYDLETSDSALNFSQILEASFIICNDNLEELERATFFARLNKNIINGNAPKVKLKDTAKDLSKISSSFIFFIKILKI